MKTLILFALSFFSLSEASLAGVKDLTPEAKELVFEAIADYVYVAKRGVARAPQNVFDFTYDLVDSETLIVTGGSYSPLDQRVLEYHCQIEILGRKPSNPAMTLKSSPVSSHQSPRHPSNLWSLLPQ